MHYEIVELAQYSGKRAKIYSIILGQKEKTLFDFFVEENKDIFRDGIKDISKRLVQIGKTTGARALFFKNTEGRYGQLVCARHDVGDKNLRLHCFHFGTVVVILGGVKEKEEIAFEGPEYTSTIESIHQYIIDSYKIISEYEIELWAKVQIEFAGELQKLRSMLNNAREYVSPILQELLDEITPVEMEQTKVKMQLAARIEDLMKARGWDSLQFAEKLDKNNSEIKKWLSGTINLTIDVLIEIAFALGVDVQTLLGKNKPH